MKLVQNTHCSLQCQYRTSLVFRRKTNANRNQTGTKYTLLLTMLVQNQSGIQKKRQMRRGIKLVQKYTLGLTILVQKQSGMHKKTKLTLTKIKLVQNTHCSLQCWYRTSLVFRGKTNANKNKTGTKYTLLLTMLVQNQSGIQKKNKCEQE